MSLKKFCDMTLSYVQNKHRFFLSLFFLKKGYCHCVHTYKNLDTYKIFNIFDNFSLIPLEFIYCVGLNEIFLKLSKDGL